MLNTYHFKKKVDVGALVHEETNRVPVDGDLEDEVRRRARLHGLPKHAVVLRVDKGLVQIQH